MSVPRPVWVLYSVEPELIQRMHGFLDATATLLVVSDQGALDLEMQRQPAALVMLDVLAPESRAVLAHLQEDHSQALIVLFAPPGLASGSRGCSGWHLRGRGR